jgi:hypothetical protein
MAQKYYDYSSMVIVATLITVGTAVYETRKVQFFWFEQNLKDRVSLGL